MISLISFDSKQNRWLNLLRPPITKKGIDRLEYWEPLDHLRLLLDLVGAELEQIF